MSESVKVGIKVRPLIECEKNKNLPIQWIVQGNSIVSLDPETIKRGDSEFHFDYIFDLDATSSNVFDSIVKPIVIATVNGFNGTVFSYGQCSSGKTHTMIGNSGELGIIPLSIMYMFKTISNTIEREFLLRVSYLEVQNETINDLLNKDGIELKFHKDNEHATVDCKEEIANTSDKMLSIMKKGIKIRKTRETDRNDSISGHSIFRITIESREISGESKSIVQVSQLNLVDLAGFESAREIAGIQEPQQTDKSLSMFESIIVQLSQSQNEQRDINVRHSKLTELLQSSLGGNSLTAIICTIIPVASKETYFTLSFARQAKNVKNKPRKNKVSSDAPFLIRYSEQLTKLQTELQRIKNGKSPIEVGSIEPKWQENYQINHLLEERVRLLKTQIISGCNANYAEPVKCKSRRRQSWCNPGTFKSHLPVFQTKTGLPTIKEMSPEKPQRKSNMQSIAVTNQTFQTGFTDFELDLIECNEGSEVKENGISLGEMEFTNNVLTEETEGNNSCMTPEKQDSSVQTSSNQGSPSTPKNVLRKYICDLTQDLIELREFTTLEKQLMCGEATLYDVISISKNLDEHTAEESASSSFKQNELFEYSSNVAIQLEEEKVKLAEELELKIQELDEIKNDIQGFKLDVEKLQNTIFLLTNENMEMSTKLTAEKERSKQIEFNLQRTIDELYARISKVTDEKISLESDVMVLNDQLQSLRLKTLEVYSDEQMLVKYQNKIDALKTENIESTAIIAEKNKELESIKESKSLLYDHECIYKDKTALLTEEKASLVLENNELSTDLIDKIEENDMLREECDILKNKISITEQHVNADENDVEQLRSENKLLKAEIMELKIKVTMLSDENVRFSNNLLETMEDLDHSRNEKLANNSLHSSSVFDNTIKKNKSAKEILLENNNETLADKVTMLQDKVDHLTRLNKKLSELKLSSCSQCVHLKSLNDSRRVLKLEAKALNCKLYELQKKFDQKCADTEALKQKANQELNLSFVDASLNASFADGLNVSFVEEKVQHLHNELQILKDDREKLSVMYREKCDELEKLHDEVGESTNVDSKSKKHVVKHESRIQQIQQSIDQVRDDIDELKKNSTNFTSVFNKFRTEKASLLDEINALRHMNEKLQQKVSDTEISAATATEKAHILETELLSMSKEIEEYTLKEKVIRGEKLTLEVELEDLKAEKENKDICITALHKTIDDLNECISSLKNELDLMTKESENDKEILKQQLQTLEVQLTDSKDNLAVKYKTEFESITRKFEEYTKESEIKLKKINETLNKYVDENDNLTQELAKLRDIELKFQDMKEKNEHVFIEEKTLANENEKLKEELNTVRECMMKELKSFKSKVNSVDYLSKTANEIFIIFLQTLMSKEEEVIKTMRELFEKDKQKLVDEKRQSADAKKRVTSWAKELEMETEKLQMDLTKRETMYKQQQDKIYHLEYVLRDANYEKETLKEKVETLEVDFNNLQAEFDKQSKVDIRQEEAISVAQKREKAVQEDFKKREIELQFKVRSEKEIYEKRIDELVYAIESYKTKNMELKGNIEGLEVNEKQLKNIIEANASELKANSQTIHKLNIELEQLTEAYNEVNHEVEQKTSHIEEIKALLKSKCDKISEYKAKLDTVVPDYEILKDQVKERKANIERYKEEIGELKMEKEKQIAMIKDNLNSEEIKNVGLNKQLHELNNKNIALAEELDTLKEKYEELQHANAKLERKIRNSTSKVKAEADMEDLRDVNKRLQNNLEGASNRITELQDSKNKILKELVNLKGQYELLSQENMEIKKTLASYKSRQSIPNSSQDDGRYDALLQEKNKIALELEDKKLLLKQKEKEVREHVSRVQDLTVKNKEFDEYLRDHATVIREREAEISQLKDKLYVHQIENKLVHENKIFNEKRQIENLTCEIDVDESDEICQMLRKKIQELELQIVSKNGQIATLEIQIQSENFPYQQKCKELEEHLCYSFIFDRMQNFVLKKWRTNRRDQYCQTSPNNASQLFTLNNEVGSVPSREVEKAEGKFWTHWNKDTKQFFLQFAFKNEKPSVGKVPPPPVPLIRPGLGPPMVPVPPPPRPPMFNPVPPPPALLATGMQIPPPPPHLA
ncbi:Centromere-associated protein E [Dufourea novaeangliae]|uniref:Centromere-associated protein E n=1 Tax=Dufourea novaeangliae TaxID=178035 RepID=A0A154P6T7_DUFNO|nr:Centromere-associated protein E [Dufourea novaeangliae]